MTDEEFLCDFGSLGGHFGSLEEKGLIEIGPGGITHRRYGPNEDDCHVINEGYLLTSKGRAMIMDIGEAEND